VVTSPSGPTGAQSCSSCGEQALRFYRRLEGSGGLRIVGTATSAGAALAGVALSSLGLLLGGVGALVGVLLLPRLGVRWWGGARCTACGHVEMLR
jgi:hypothetical protein